MEGSKSSSWSIAIALCAVMVILWSAIILKVWKNKPSPGEGALSVPTAAAVVPPAGILPAAAPAAEPKTEAGRSARRLATLLSQGRVAAETIRTSGTAATAEQKEQAASVEREAQDLSRALAENLRKSAVSWPDVLDVASRTEDLKVAVRLGTMMAEAMDETGEGVCISGLARQDLARGRQVAAAALAGGKTLNSVAALIDAADRDADGNVRYSAVTSLSQRRLGASEESRLSIESALRRRAQSDSDEYIRQIAKSLVEPEANPHAKRLDPIKKRPPLQPAPPK